MKFRVFFLLSAVSLFALSSCRDHLTGPPNSTSSDTIAWYPHPLLDSKDASGHGHDGLPVIALPLTATGKDRFGNLNLTGDEIVVTNTNGLNFTGNDSYTLSAWVEMFAPYAGGPIVAKSPSIQPPVGYELLAGPDGEISIYINDSLNSNEDKRFETINLLHPDSEWKPGGWHMVTLVVKAHESISVYLDSVLLVTRTDNMSTMAPNIGNDTTSMVMGAFDMLIDDIVILNAPASSDWVAARFHEGGWYEHTDTVVTPPHTDTVWTPVNTGISDNLIVGQFVNSTAGFVGGQYGVFLATSDSGMTWSVRASAPIFTGSLIGNIYGLKFFDAQNGIVAGDQRDISMTTDGGYTWQAMDASQLPQTDLIRSMAFTNQSTGFVGTADAYAGSSGSICRTTDGGLTWSSPIFFTAGGVYNIDFNTLSSNRNGVATGNHGVAYWTTDGGSTWNPGTTDLTTGIIMKSAFITPTTAFAVAIVDDTHGYILQSNDAGHSWHTIKTVPYGLRGIAYNGNFVQTDVSPHRITVVGSSGVVFESTDGGSSWSTSFEGSSTLYDIRYSSYTHAAIFGVNGAIYVRDK